MPPAGDATVVALHEILSRVAPADIEPVLASSGLSPTPRHVESVLRLSYSFPSAAVKFFRWSGQSMKHSPLAWNLIIDILGKNADFDAMWDAIRSTKTEGAISFATFASAFGSYCAADKIEEAIMSFEVMDRYGVPKDVVAVNCLLSAICRCDGRMADALSFYDKIKRTVELNVDTFAILLEGWEKECNVAGAKKTFREMVAQIGWSSEYMLAYDSFLTTIILGPQPDDALPFLQTMISRNCLPEFKFFAKVLDVLVKKNLHVLALTLWNCMVKDCGIIPNLAMYDGIITLLCRNNDLNPALQLFEGMPYVGVFPDAVIYNAILECLIINKEARKAESLFVEMRKNELLPSASNCALAIRMFFNEYDSAAAFDVWECVLDNQIGALDESAGELLIGLMHLGRLDEVKRLAIKFSEREIRFQPFTMERLKTSFYKAKRENDYDRIKRILQR